MVRYRYGVAVAVACVISVGGLVIASRLRTSILQLLRDETRQATAAGKLPKELEGVGIDHLTLEGFDTELPASVEWRWFIADAIEGLWFVWIPAAFAISLGAAFFAGRWLTAR